MVRGSESGIGSPADYARSVSSQSEIYGNAARVSRQNSRTALLSVFSEDRGRAGVPILRVSVNFVDRAGHRNFSLIAYQASRASAPMKAAGCRLRWTRILVQDGNGLGHGFAHG